ncbi:MAG: hypothetical protein ACP5OA_03500 [Candidatus Woesearchaeota archaeon]
METSKRVIEIPRQLQCGDYIFTVVAYPLDEKTSMTGITSKLEWFSVKPNMVVGLKFDPSNHSKMIIETEDGDKVSLLADGKLNDDSGVILNEDKAREAVLTMYAKEIEKAEDLHARISKGLDQLKELEKTFTNKPLNKEGYTVVIQSEGSCKTSKSRR